MPGTVRSVRIVTWNVRGAAAGRNTWELAAALGADILMVQESGTIPVGAFPRHALVEHRTIRKGGGEQQTAAVLLVRGKIVAEVPLRVRQEHEHLLRLARNNMHAHEVALDHGERIGVLHAYCPPWPLERMHGSDVWLTHLLEDAVRNLEGRGGMPWVVAGDLNLSETFDMRSREPRGNKAFLDAMTAAGMIECLRHSRGALTPTYRHRDGSLIHQIDHLFVNGPLAERLLCCDTAPAELVFAPRPRLSDHLPIIADFR